MTLRKEGKRLVHGLQEQTLHRIEDFIPARCRREMDIQQALRLKKREAFLPLVSPRRQARITPTRGGYIKALSQSELRQATF
jgi:hypothetical protein